MIRVALVDDHAFLVEVLSRVLARAGDLDLVAVCTSGAEALSVLPSAGADVVILDQGLPDIEGLEVLRRLVADGITARVLMFSAGLRDDFAERALACGAAGAMSKLSGAVEVTDVVRRIAAGEQVVVVDPP